MVLPELVGRRRSWRTSPMDMGRLTCISVSSYGELLASRYRSKVPFQRPLAIFISRGGVVSLFVHGDHWFAFQPWHYGSENSIQSMIPFGFLAWMPVGRFCLQIVHCLHGNYLPWPCMSDLKPQMLSLLLPFLLMTILSAGARRSYHCSDTGIFMPRGNYD